MATETLLTRPRRPQKRAGRHCCSGDPPECRVRPPSCCLQQWEDDDRQTAGSPRRPCSLGEADGATLEPRGPLVHLACRFCYWVQRPARAEPSSPPLSRHPRSAALRSAPRPPSPFCEGPSPGLPDRASCCSSRVPGTLEDWGRPWDPPRTRPS